MSDNQPAMIGAMILWYQYDSNAPTIQVTMPAGMPLDEVLDGMTGFLLAAGYNFEGSLDIVQGPNTTLN